MTDLKDRFKKAAKRERSHPTNHVDVEDVLGEEKEVKSTVRFTLDLEKELHMQLKTFALKNEVKAAEVLRVLLKKLEEDADLRVKVQAELAMQQLSN